LFSIVVEEINSSVVEISKLAYQMCPCTLSLSVVIAKIASDTFVLWGQKSVFFVSTFYDEEEM
jgi:hypothetical protein